MEREESLVGQPLPVRAEVFLGNLRPQDVVVQVYSGGLDREENVVGGQAVDLQHVEEMGDGRHVYHGSISCEQSGRFGYLVRVLPWHLGLRDSFALELMRWIDTGGASGAKKQARVAEAVR